MKTIKLSIRQIVPALFFTLLILGGNVNAKGTEVAIASGLENTVESEMKVEDWMVNESHWKITENVYFTEETEENMQVESWMTDENTWELSSVGSLENETENELTLDNWMINADYWNN